jgi:hypothetical protein
VERLSLTSSCRFVVALGLMLGLWLMVMGRPAFAAVPGRAYRPPAARRVVAAQARHHAAARCRVVRHGRRRAATRICRHRVAGRHHPKPVSAPAPVSPPAPVKPPAPVVAAAVSTSAAAPPAVQTGAVSAITGTGATVAGTVDPHGVTTTYAFQWGTTTGYGGLSPTTGLGDGSGALPVASALTGLAPMTTYHLRIVANDCGGCAAGTSYGQDVTFTTSGYVNPVYGPDETADPSVLDNDGAHNDYWAFVTGDRFPILRSSDLVHWTSVGPAMTARPSWVVQTGDWHPWAPHVVQTAGRCPGASSPGCYVMYYVGLSSSTNANCVGVATSSAPGGPYTDQGPLSNATTDAEGRPVGCGDNAGYGQIDPSLFIDPATGRRYLYVSEDFACPSQSTSCTSQNSTLQPTISVIPLSDDSLSATGPRTPLFSGDPGSWEAAGTDLPGSTGVSTVEGPMMIEHDGTYYLLYSGGSWRSQYAMGYATASSPLGPFTKAAANPILQSTTSVIGPGGGDVPVTGPSGGLWLVYHGRSTSDDVRVMRVDPFSWTLAAGGPAVPTIGGPTSTPQAVLP